MLPPALASVYDPVNMAITAAQTRLNQDVSTLQPITGKLLDNADAFSQQITNNAWRKLQYFLANRGYMRFTKRQVVTPLPISGNLTDPTVQSWINWFNYYNGVTLGTTPTLPGDFMFPLSIRERITGSNQVFRDMGQWTGPLPSLPKQTYNGIWQWDNDQINFPGATVPLDIELYYASLLGDFVDVGTTRWYQLSIPMVGAVDALSLYICAELVGSRDNPDLTAAAVYTEAAENAAKLIRNRDARMKSRVNIQRRSASGRLEYGQGGGLGNGWW